MADKKLMLAGLLLFMFLLCFNGVNAFSTWRQEGGVSVDVLEIQYYYPYYSLMSYQFDWYNMNITNESFSKCSLPSSDYTPIVGDLDNDYYNEIYLFNDDEINVYDIFCQETETIYLDDDLHTMPVLTSPDDDGNQILVALLEIGVNDYYGNLTGYGLDEGEYTQLFNVEVPHPDSYQYIQKLACGIDTCFVTLGAEGFKQYFIPFSLDNYSFYGSPISTVNVYTPFYDDAFNKGDYNGMTVINNEPSSYNDLLIVNGYGVDGASKYIKSKIYRFAQTGEEVMSCLGTESLGTASDFYYTYGSIAEVGNVAYYFHHGMVGSKTGYLVSDIYGNVITERVMTTSNQKLMFSNFAVGDYNLDGFNEYCHIINETDSNESIYLRCYDEDNNLVDEVNYTGVMSGINNIGMIWYGAIYDTMAIVTAEGVFVEINDTPTKLYSSGNTGVYDGFVVTTSDNMYNASPIAIYTDNTGLNSVLIKVQQYGDYYYCGDGVCQSWLGENLITCFADCQPTAPEEEEEDEEPPETGELPEGWKCSTNADCEFGLTCQYGVCSTSGHGAECDEDSDCISGECTGGYCTKPSTWDLMDASKNQQFGDDTNTNNFIALGIMIALAGMLGFYAGIWVGIASFFMSAIFFVMVGWLSGFILIGLLIVGVIALFFSFMAHSSGGQ